TFTATAGVIASDQSAIVTAAIGSTSRTASISLVAPRLVWSLQCVAASLVSSGATPCTVTLSTVPAAAGTIVSLTSSLANLTVPLSETVAANATTTAFNATAGIIDSDQSATLTAAVGSSSQTASILLISHRFSSSESPSYSIACASV